MKTVGLEEATLDACVKEAQHERVVVTRDGKPVALIVGIEGFDREQLELARDAAFRTLIAERRAQRAVGRTELERKVRSTR